MANRSKAFAEDMDRKQLEKYLAERGVRGFSHTKFNKKFEVFCEAHDLKLEDFYINIKSKGASEEELPKSESERPNLILKGEWKNLVLLLLETYNNNPFLIQPFDQDGVKYSSIDEYYSRVIDLVETTLNEDEKYDITYSATFFRTVLERQAIKMLKRSLQELAATIKLIRFDARIDLFREIIETVNGLIIYAYDRELVSEQESKRRYKCEQAKWLQSAQLEYENVVSELKSQGIISPDMFHDKAIDLMKNSVTAMILSIEEKIIDASSEAAAESNIHEFIISKLKERMQIHPLDTSDDDFHYCNPPTERDKKTMKAMAPIEKYIANIDLLKQTAQEYGLSFEEIMVDLRKDLIRNADAELQVRLEDFTRIEPINDKVAWMLKDKTELDNDSRETFVNGFTAFYEQVKKSADDIPNDFYNLIEEPILQAFLSERIKRKDV